MEVTMRKNYFKAIFIVIGIITVFLSIGTTLALLYKKFTIELFDGGAFSDEPFIEEDEVYEPIIVCAEADEETGEPQNI